MPSLVETSLKLVIKPSTISQLVAPLLAANLPMLLLTIIAYYLLIGCAFGVAFFLRGYAVIAPEARGASIVMRLLWTPAAIAFWPLLAHKWRAARQAEPPA